METVERLKALTLMTYADISAVNPTAMTPWRAEVLWQLYLLTYNELTRELADRPHPRPRLRTRPRSARFWPGCPMRYARTHTAEEIDAHLRLDGVFRQRGVAVALEKLEAAWRLTLVTGDRPFLFASVAGTLSSFGMNILKAEAFSNQPGHRAGYLHFRRSHAHAGAESHRDRPPARHRGAGGAGPPGRAPAFAEPSQARAAQPQFAGAADGVVQSGGVGYAPR